MQNEVIFQQNFIYDPTSPTGLRNRRTKKPAGYKNKDGYYVVTLNKGENFYCWSLARALFELVYEVELTRSLVVVPVDGNYDNFKISNLAAVPVGAAREMKNQRV